MKRGALSASGSGEEPGHQHERERAAKNYANIEETIGDRGFGFHVKVKQKSVS